MSHRLCFALDLVADDHLIKEYENRHRPGSVWPEVLREMRERGIESMEIWSVANRLFMITEVTDDYPRPVAPFLQHQVARWETEMEQYQSRIVPTDSKWALMRCIFRLADH